MSTRGCLTVALLLAPGLLWAQSMAGMAMPASTPGAARSGDYSDGYAASPMSGMDMGSGAQSMLLVDQLEGFAADHASGAAWEAQAWYGGDSNKLWLRSEGERDARGFDDADVEALWAHAVSAFWNTQLGLRQDIGPDAHRRWAAFGVQGLAPYGVDIQATAYAGDHGQLAARLRAEYPLRITQRLVLQPELEVNAYSKDDPAAHTGDGVGDAQLGLRLRYEISQQFAPYIGLQFERRFGATAAYFRQDQQPVFDRQIVAGVRFWF